MVSVSAQVGLASIQIDIDIDTADSFQFDTTTYLVRMFESFMPRAQLAVLRSTNRSRIDTPA
jgi:hypothetical protein